MDMEPVFSMEEIFGPAFWDLPPPSLEQQPLVMTGTGSVVIDGVVVTDHGGGDGVGAGGMTMDQNNTVWTFERLVAEEELLTNTTLVANSSFPALNVQPVVEVDHTTMAPAAVSAVADPMEYNAILKKKLEEDLVAFKMWRASSSGVNSEGSNNLNGGSKNKLNGEDPINNHAQNADLPRVRLANSSSSRDPSPSDEEVDGGDVEILGFKMPTEERLRKRKESNRESARRSRYRKAAHLKDLEDQVEQLKAENSSLLRRLGALNKKYHDANVDNRVLRADMETLRAKVKIGEDSLKRVLEMSSMPSIPIPELPGSDVSVPIPDDIMNYFTTPADDALVDNSFMPMPNPFQLQAEEPTISGTLNTTAEINRIAALQEPGELLGLPNETLNMDMF